MFLKKYLENRKKDKFAEKTLRYLCVLMIGEFMKKRFNKEAMKMFIENLKVLKETLDEENRRYVNG